MELGGAKQTRRFAPLLRRVIAAGGVRFKVAIRRGMRPEKNQESLMKPVDPLKASAEVRAVFDDIKTSRNVK